MLDFRGLSFGKRILYTHMAENPSLCLFSSYYIEKPVVVQQRAVGIQPIIV